MQASREQDLEAGGRQEEPIAPLGTALHCVGVQLTATHVLDGLSGDEDAVADAGLGLASTYCPTEESSRAPLPKPVAMSVMLTCSQAA